MGVRHINGRTWGRGAYTSKIMRVSYMYRLDDIHGCVVGGAASILAKPLLKQCQIWIDTIEQKLTRNVEGETGRVWSGYLV